MRNYGAVNTAARASGSTPLPIITPDSFFSSYSCQYVYYFSKVEGGQVARPSLLSWHLPRLSLCSGLTFQRRHGTVGGHDHTGTSFSILSSLVVVTTSPPRPSSSLPPFPTHPSRILSIPPPRWSLQQLLETENGARLLRCKPRGRHTLGSVHLLGRPLSKQIGLTPISWTPPPPPLLYTLEGSTVSERPGDLSPTWGRVIGGEGSGHPRPSFVSLGSDPSRLLARAFAVQPPLPEESLTIDPSRGGIYLDGQEAVGELLRLPLVTPPFSGVFCITYHPPLVTPASGVRAMGGGGRRRPPHGAQATSLIGPVGRC